MKVIDLETTGLRSDSEIAQMAIWTLDDNLRPVSYKNMFFNISTEMPEGAYKANQLSKAKLEQLSNGAYFKDVKDEIKRELQGEIVIAHNASFEKRVLDCNLGEEVNVAKWVCTMKRYTPTLALKDRAGNNGYKSCNLRELVDYVLQVKNMTMEELEESYKKITGENPRFHDALFDTYCTAIAFNTLG